MFKVESIAQQSIEGFTVVIYYGHPIQRSLLLELRFASTLQACSSDKAPLQPLLQASAVVGLGRSVCIQLLLQSTLSVATPALQPIMQKLKMIGRGTCFLKGLQITGQYESSSMGQCR